MKILILILTIIFIYHLLIYLVFLYTFSNKVKVDMGKMMRNGYAEILQERKTKMLSYPMKEVSVKSFDDLKLYGRYFHHEGSERLIIMCHGWKSEWYIDFSEIALWFYEHQRCDLLIIDERAIGKSEGKYITFGTNEGKDIQEWIRWAHSIQNLPIYLYGTSMGAASVLLAAEGMNDDINGIIADSPFFQPYEELKDFSKRILHLPEYPFMFSFKQYTRFFMHVDLKEADARNILPYTTMPILIFHGTTDFFCNVKMSKDLKMQNYQNVTVQIFEDCNHCCGYVKYKEQYQKQILNLFQK